MKRIEVRIRFYYPGSGTVKVPLVLSFTFIGKFWRLEVTEANVSPSQLLLSPPEALVHHNGHKSRKFC